jgi:methionyl aminopeptidase
VNDAIVHGIPDGYRLRDGDLVSIDFGAKLGGWAGDSAISFIVGEPRPADVRLVDTAERALAAGIEAAVVGNRIGDIAHAIGTVCRTAGYGIPDGLRRPRHRPPDARGPARPERGPPRPRPPLRHGMVLAIEPMLIAGGRRRLPRRPGRLDPPHERRHPRGPRPPHPHPAVTEWHVSPPGLTPSAAGRRVAPWRCPDE